MRNFLPSKLWIRLIILLVLLMLIGVGAAFIYQKSKSQPTQPALNKVTEDGVVIPPLPVDRPMKIAINEAKAENGKLHVAITVENRGNLGFDKLLYYASLEGKSEETKTSDGNILVLKPMPIAQINSAPFPLKSGKVEQFQFDLNYPKGAPTGEYDLKVEVRPMEDTYYAFETQKISLTGSGSDLNIPSYQGCRIKVGNTTYDSFSPVITPSESVKAECDVTNSGKQSTNAKPIVTYAKRADLRSGSEVKIIDNLPEISLAPNEKKTVQFSLPPQSTPQIYEAQIQFVGEDNLPLSNYGFVRYVVKGPSPLVNRAELSTSTISKRDLVSLNVQVSPSGDIFYDGKKTDGTFLKQPKLTAKLTSGTTTCVEKTVDLPANATTWNDEVTIDFKAETDCWDPLLTLKISEGGQELTTFQKQYLSSSVNNDFKSTSIANPRSVLWAVLIAIFILIIVIVLLLVLKKKKSPNNPIVKLLIFFAATAILFAGASFYDTVNADITVGPGGQIGVTRGGTGPYTVTYNSSSSLTQTNPSNVHVFWGADVAAPSQWWYMSDKVRNFVNGGQVGPDYNFSTQNTGNGHQNVDHHYDVAASGGQSVMSRLYAVMVGPCCSEQANSGSGTNGDGGNNNCGSAQPCYGQLTLSVPVPCSPTTQTTTAACPAGQWGTVYLRNDYVCPGQYWTGWYESPPRNCHQPYVTLSISQTTGYTPQAVTLSWTTGEHNAGVTCASTWNSFLSIPATSSGSDTRTITSPGNYGFRIDCSDGYSSPTVYANISQLPAPKINFPGTSCSTSTPSLSMRLEAVNIGFNTSIKLFRDGTLVYTSPALGPGGYVDISNANFNDPYKPVTPGAYYTFTAVTSVSGKTDSASSAAVGISTANCPSPPLITAVNPVCSGNNPHLDVSFTPSTYGNPLSYYHLDRKLYPQTFGYQGDGYIGSYAPSTNPIRDSNVLNNTSYSYRMRADNGIQSDPSNVGTGSTMNCTPPTVTLIRNECTGNYPDVIIRTTAPSNQGQTAGTWTDMISPTNTTIYYNAFAPGQSIDIGNGSFAGGYSTLQSLTSYSIAAKSGYNTYTPYGPGVSFSTKECNGPKPFTLSLDSAPVCPADGLPKINLRFTKSANATQYHIYVYTIDGANNPVTNVVAETNIASNTLFPGIAIDVGGQTTTRTYSVNPNARYGAYIVAQKNAPSGSWIYSNQSLMNGASGENPWIFTTNLGWCDTQAPQISLMNLMLDCYQPDTWTSAQPMTTLVADVPKAGAPANSVSGIRDVYYALVTQGTNLTTTPASNANYNFLATLRTVGASTYYDRTFTTANLSSGPNRLYTLGSRACDNNNNCAIITPKDFLYTNICTGWIQTHGGNVHTEGNLNAPGGPQ